MEQHNVDLTDFEPMLDNILMHNEETELDRMLNELTPAPFWYRGHDGDDFGEEDLYPWPFEEGTSSSSDDEYRDWEQFRIDGPEEDLLLLYDNIDIMWDRLEYPQQQDETRALKLAARNLQVLECARTAALHWLLISKRLAVVLPPEMALRIAVEIYDSGLYEDELWSGCCKLTKAIQRCREAGFEMNLN